MEKTEYALQSLSEDPICFNVQYSEVYGVHIYFDDKTLL